jgi:hypothetical protein
MTYTYEEIIHEDGSKILKRTDETGSVVWIPLDESNSDYQRYLNPEAEQSTPNLTIGGNN